MRALEPRSYFGATVLFSCHVDSYFALLHSRMVGALGHVGGTDESRMLSANARSVCLAYGLGSYMVLVGGHKEPRRWIRRNVTAHTGCTTSDYLPHN